MKIVSFGGGVNSTALLIGLKERGEIPDATLFADTGGEKPETYEHLRVMGDWCKASGMPEITTVKEKLTLEDDCLNRESLPAKAFGFGTCSARFKVQPQQKWVREQGIVDAVWLVGIHFGEQRRAKRTVNDHGHAIRYPLIEWGWGQSDCHAAILLAGLPVPVKSACFYCPSMKKPEIIALSKEHPELFARAVEMERNAVESGNLETVKGLGRNYTWEALVKADEAQVRLPMFRDDQAPLCDACMDD